MELIYYPNPKLREEGKEVLAIDDEVKERVKQMFEIMYKNKGIGLAAQQVGWPVRLFITNIGGEPKDEMIFINPEIISKEGEEIGEEGCLSFPDIKGNVERATHIEFTAYDLDGNKNKYTTEKLMARVVLHEYDHIIGILFTDKMSSAAKVALKPQLKALEKSYKELQNQRQ